PQSFQVTPIGYVRGSRTEIRDDFWGGSEVTIELTSDVPVESLIGIEEFSHLEILFLFDRDPSDTPIEWARHPRGNPAWPRVGVFAQRARKRPNRLGATIVRLVGCRGRNLTVVGLDAIDGTPELDIKPVFREF